MFSGLGPYFGMQTLHNLCATARADLDDLPALQHVTNSPRCEVLTFKYRAGCLLPASSFQLFTATLETGNYMDLVRVDDFVFEGFPVSVKERNSKASAEVLDGGMIAISPLFFRFRS